MSHKRKRLAVARFWFEGNAFSPIATTLRAFEAYEWQVGPVAQAVIHRFMQELRAGLQAGLAQGGKGRCVFVVARH